MVGIPAVVVGFAALVVAYSLGRYLLGAHGDLLAAREETERAWSNVEVLLERRYDHLGALIDVAVEQMDHEREVVRELADARTEAIEAATPTRIARAEVDVQNGLRNLNEFAEEYPEFESTERFEELQDRLGELEGRLESRREYYNDAVATFNARLRTVPERFFADWEGFERREPFEASDEAREGLDVRERFAG